MSCGKQLKHKIWRKNIHKNALAIWMYFNASDANTATIIIIINWHWTEHTKFSPWNKRKMTIVGWLCRLQQHYFVPMMAFYIECLIFRHFDVYAINASKISMARFGLLFFFVLAWIDSLDFNAFHSFLFICCQFKIDLEKSHRSTTFKSIIICCIDNPINIHIQAALSNVTLSMQCHLLTLYRNQTTRSIMCSRFIK